MPKFYTDTIGNYIGAFEGQTGKVPQDAIETPTAPLHADAKWDGTQWIEPEISDDVLVESEVQKKGVTDSEKLDAIFKKIAFNDSSLFDQIVKAYTDAQQTVANIKP